MSRSKSHADTENASGVWVVARIFIWFSATALVGMVMIGAQGSAIRAVAIALIVSVASALHLAFRPPTVSARPSVAPKPQSPTEVVDNLHRRLVR